MNERLHFYWIRFGKSVRKDQTFGLALRLNYRRRGVPIPDEMNDCKRAAFLPKRMKFLRSESTVAPLDFWQRSTLADTLQSRTGDPQRSTTLTVRDKRLLTVGGVNWSLTMRLLNF